MKIFDDILILLQFNHILSDFMIILRDSKLILYSFNLIHITSNKNYFLFSININNIKYFIKYFTQNPGFLTPCLTIYTILQEIKKNLKDSNVIQGILSAF
jgi:hypothetical protein